MGDLHYLPLRSRDLPEEVDFDDDELYEVEPTPEAIASYRSRLKKAQVFKDRGDWYWEHECAWKGTPSNSYPLRTQRQAFGQAWRHVERCI